MIDKKLAEHFANDWIDSWKRWHDPEGSVEVTYERLLCDTHAAMVELARHFGLPAGPLEDIVSTSAFEQVKTGGTFYRKGAVGDWANYFDAALKAQFKRAVGTHLIEWGYEKDLDW